MSLDLASIQTLEDWKRAVDAFEGCPLKQYATQAVYADGNPQADIMLVGEAPGAEEDRLGKPFVGRSGQLLDKMLAAVGLNRAENVYISNTTWWRPPDNRTPTPAEIATCRPLLLKHIQLVQPKLLVAVGGTAVKALLETQTGIMKLRGQWQPFEVYGTSIPVLPMFHPAYLLRNPPAKREAWADLKVLRAKAEELGIAMGPMHDPQKKDAA